jgi:gamma-glutamyltranspeptidase/glutathione hydrolase/leukotriene-C4 hydrolase
MELNPRVEKIHLVALCTYMAGGLAVAVPGELAGYWAAHQQYGKLNWSRLVLPTAEMVEKGIPVNSHLANSLQEFQKLVIDEPSMQ